MAAKFKKGDRVRWTRTDRQYQTATVTENDTSMFDYRIEQDGDYTYAYEHELVPVAEATGKDAEPKFKVGDRVKFRDDYNSSARGTEATVVNVDSWGIMVDGVHGTSTEQPSSLRLVAEATSGKFKVGDRVRCVEACPGTFTVGKEYTVAYYDEDQPRLGVTEADHGGPDGISARFFEPATAPTLTIQAGRYYRTRDGRKVGPMLIWDKDSEWPWSDHVDSGSGIWRGDGTVFDYAEDDDDLIAEWVDEPANDNSTAGFTIPLEEEDGDIDELVLNVSVNSSSAESALDRLIVKLTTIDGLLDSIASKRAA